MAVSLVSPIDRKTIVTMDNNEEIGGIKRHLDFHGLERFAALLEHECVDKR